ncbi:unnamed protein product [Bursaphelenchus xylophilus]|uniref:(pine wood nematode) hypothetical protein n=1 Tax=Bursaphelenchus xylophilus TaxID=6326 RepID=A0A1I7RWP6_BURXY|nr:unnamed protein product [Bursaphelenchus xylophilus]CAG9128548.1 unnamed protein product [Bursaphelenchus xylophilus]
MGWQDVAAELMPFYDYGIGMLSYILNILVIYLALTQFTKSTAEYKTIILLNCVVDLIFNTVNVLTRTVADVQDGNLFLLSTGPLGEIPQPYAAMITFFWVWSLLLTVVTVPMQFLYRYSMLCLKNPLSLKHYVLIYGGFILATALHCAAGVFVFETDPKLLKEYEPLLRKNPMFKEHLPVFTLGIKDSPKQAFHMMDVVLIAGVAYSLVVFCGIRTFQRLKETRDSLSKKTLAVQRQMTIIMAIQATNPLIMLNGPTVGACLLALFNVTFSGVSFFTTPVIACIPILNPLCVIMVIPSFRRFITCHRLRHGKRIGATSEGLSTRVSSRQT